MIVLGGLSAVVSVLDPLSASFLISAAVLVNGLLERHFAVQLEEREPSAVGRLAANQAALGTEIAVYSIWQARAATPEAIERYLSDPRLAGLIDMYPREQMRELIDFLPRAIQTFYAAVAAVAVVACALTALFYLSRRKHLATLAHTYPTATH